jgi:hypothetical protein
LIDVLGDPSRRAYATMVLSEIGEPAIPALIEKNLIPKENFDRKYIIYFM